MYGVHYGNINCSYCCWVEFRTVMAQNFLKKSIYPSCWDKGRCFEYFGGPDIWALGFSGNRSGPPRSRHHRAADGRRGGRSHRLRLRRHPQGSGLGISVEAF